jgi:hypothetical protein
MELPRRNTLPVLVLVGAALFAVPTVRTFALATREEMPTATGVWSMAVALLLLVEVVPVGLAVLLLRSRYVLDHDAIALVRGGRVRRRLAFAELTSVRFGRDGGLGITSRTTAVELRAQDAALRVSGLFVDDLGPLLDRIREEEARRPGLVVGDPAPAA